MRNSQTGERLEVHDEGTAGPYLMVPPEQTAEVLGELGAVGITGARDSDGISVDGELQEEVINFGRGQDAAEIQQALDAAEYGKVQAGLMGMNLDVKVRQRSWNLSIRRVDGKPDPDFSALNDKLVSQDDLREFIPKPQELDWTDSAGFAPLNRPESRAEAPPYRVHLLYASNVDPSTVKAEFAEDFS